MQFPNPYYVTFVIPTGATSGARIVLNGTTGQIEVYNSANVLVDTIGGPNGDIKTTDGVSSIIMRSGQILFQNPLNNVDGDITISGDTLSIQGPASAAFPNPLEALWIDGAGTTTGLNSPYLLVRSPSTGAADEVVQGSVIFADTGGTRATWQAASGFTVNFAAGSTASVNYQNLQYRYDPMNNLFIEGAVHALNALAAGPYTIFTLPAAYRPTKIHATTGIHASNVDVSKSAIRVNVDLTGAVGFYTLSAIAVNDNFYFSFIVPLGVLP